MVPLFFPFQTSEAPSLSDEFSNASLHHHQHTHTHLSRQHSRTASAAREVATRPHASRACAPPEDTTTAINSIPPPPPALSSLAELTPQSEYFPDLATLRFQQSLDLPTSPVAGASPIPKSMRVLRLPSFDALGIALPSGSSKARVQSVDSGAHATCASKGSNRSNLRRSSLPHLPDFPPSPVGDEPPHPQSPGPLQPGFRAVKSFVLTHTPPDDSGALDWGMPEVKTASGTPSDRIPLSEASSITPIGAVSESVKGSGLGMAGQSSFDISAGRAPWLADALSTILDIVHKHNHLDAIRILSHALPSPSTNGHAFPLVIESIQQSTTSSSIMWMNVWHAVSGRFKFEDLPKSPPTTPAPPFEGDDYFTQRVFDCAVEVPDYSQKLAAQPLTPRLQRPAVAPNSIDVSIVERYIPPTSTTEFEELFSVSGRSFLNDRLIELSPDHGTLLFIYPTKAGAETFRHDYLDPVLAPTLRSMMVEHDLPHNLAAAVGTMTAIEALPTFSEMVANLTTYLNTLNNNGNTTPTRYRLHGNSQYTLVHSAAQEVLLDRAVWSKDWWNKQEKTRIQRAFETHDVQGARGVRQAGAFQASEHLATATRETQQADESKMIQRAATQSLLREAERSRGERHPGDNEQLILRLMEEVAGRKYKNGLPEKGVEVGVFVIQKRRRT